MLDSQAMVHAIRACDQGRLLPCPSYLIRCGQVQAVFALDGKRPRAVSTELKSSVHIASGGAFGLADASLRVNAVCCVW